MGLSFPHQGDRSRRCGDVSWPDDFSLFSFDGNEVARGPSKRKQAHVEINAPTDKFSLLWVFRKVETPLVGKVLGFALASFTAAARGTFPAPMVTTLLKRSRQPVCSSADSRKQNGFAFKARTALQAGSIIDVADNRGVISH